MAYQPKQTLRQILEENLEGWKRALLIEENNDCVMEHFAREAYFARMKHQRVKIADLEFYIQQIDEESADPLAPLASFTMVERG